MGKKKILVVEDEAASRQVMALRLRSLDYDAIPVADATTALSAARQQHPDLIILDLGLPGGGGLAFLQRMRMMPQLAVIPVIVVSAHERSVAEQPALQAGAAAFFQKPANPEELVQKIRELLGQPDMPSGLSGRSV